MRALARFFNALGAFFESKATSQQLAARIEIIEAEQASLRDSMTQLRTDMSKCKLIVGLNQLTDVSA
jgi:hypothetical protein